jgi:hypothetical protein
MQAAPGTAKRKKSRTGFGAQLSASGAAPKKGFGKK